MILSSIREFRRYRGLNSRFGTLANALESLGLATLAPGRHDVLGDDLYVIASPQAKTQPSTKLEAHRRYVDVHLPLDGSESIGWAPTESMLDPEAPFDVDRDFGCFRDSFLSVLVVAPGQLAVFFPEDAHAPLLGDGKFVHKCVFKVLVDDT